MSDLRKAAQDVLTAADNLGGCEGGQDGRDELDGAAEALRAALATCPDCGKPTPEGSVHTCGPQKPDSDVCEWTCKACRETGLLHCSDPEHCGGMIYTESEASRNSRRYKWLVDYSLASTNTHDEAIINATTLEEFNAAIDAAMQQEQNNGTF